MKKILNSKGQELGINKMIIIVIVVLVLVAVIFFIFRADILQRINNSPGYTYSTEDKEIIIQDADMAAKTSYCPVKIGEVTFGKQINLMDVIFDRNGKLKLSSPGTYRYTWRDFTIENNIVYIFFPAYTWRRDIKIGYVDEHRQVIIPRLGDCSNYKTLIETIGSTQLLSMPTLDELKLINGAYLQGNNLCIGPKQLASYEQDIGTIRKANNGRSSNIVRLVFVKGIKDYVDVWWDNDKKGVGIYVYPNGNEIGENKYFPGEMLSTQFVDTAFYSKQELLANSQFNSMKGKIYNDDLERIYKLFDNQNPEQLVSYIGDLENVENHGRVFVLNNKLAPIFQSTLSDLLYCTDGVPDITAGSIINQILAFSTIAHVSSYFSGTTGGTSSPYSIGGSLDGWYLYAYNEADKGTIPERCADAKALIVGGTPGQNCLCLCRDAGCNNVEVKAKAKNWMEDECMDTNFAVKLFDLNKKSQTAISMNGKNTITIENKAGVINLYA